MARWTTGAILLFVTGATGQSEAAGPAVDGNLFRAMTNEHRIVFVTGAVDGITVGLGVARGDIARWDACTTDRTVAQMQAIFEKYLAQNPERWHLPAAVLLYASLTDATACPKRSN